ncbi:MAG: AAA family ATPase [Patescibacteria group bacterium]|nr:AAA family ATPase [Patescibacteria group bacterium]
MDQNIQNIKQTQYILLNKIDLKFKRFLFDKIDFKQRLIGIIGPRGVGKTTLILQYLKEKHYQDDKAIYFLADNVLFNKGDLLELAREFYLKHSGRLMCIDEIHRYANWNQELKNIYDTLPDLKIIFSGSSSLNLIKGKYDLSRRGVIYNLPGFSFREYLLFQENINIQKFSLNKLIKNYKNISINIAKNQNILKYFNEYLVHGYYPFFKETKNKQLYFQQLNNIIDKIIYEDIASFYHLKTQNLIVFKQILYFLATISPGEINPNKLANSLNKNYATISEYLDILEQTGLIRFLTTNKTGHSLIRYAKKVFLDNTNLLHTINKTIGSRIDIGATRELFILNQLQNAGHIPVYSAQGDLKVNNFIFEVGGRKKSNKQIQDLKNAFLVLDDILISDRNKIPLYLFGFFY